MSPSTPGSVRIGAPWAAIAVPKQWCSEWIVTPGVYFHCLAASSSLRASFTSSLGAIASCFLRSARLARFWARRALSRALRSASTPSLELASQDGTPGAVDPARRNGVDDRTLGDVEDTHPRRAQARHREGAQRDAVRAHGLGLDQPLRGGLRPRPKPADANRESIETKGPLGRHKGSESGDRTLYPPSRLVRSPRPRSTRKVGSNTVRAENGQPGSRLVRSPELPLEAHSGARGERCSPVRDLACSVPSGS